MCLNIPPLHDRGPPFCKDWNNNSNETITLKRPLMKYYTFSDTNLDTQKECPQTWDFIKEYNPDSPTGVCSFCYNHYVFPDYTPDLDGFKLQPGARLTDFVTTGIGSSTLVTPKCKAVMEQFALLPHRFYPTGLYKRNIRYDYYFFFHLFWCYPAFVDYKKTTFYKRLDPEKKPLDIETRYDFLRYRSQTPYIETDQVVLLKSFNKELDMFDLSPIYLGMIVSERFKNAIEEAGLTGQSFKPLPEDTIVFQ